MADDLSMICFRSGVADLDAAANALKESGLTVTRKSQELRVRSGDGPELRVALNRRKYVIEEAQEIGADSPYAAKMAQCDARFEIFIDDLEEVLDEINTLIEVQATLQKLTQGFLFNSWNGEIQGPDE